MNAPYFLNQLADFVSNGNPSLSPDVMKTTRDSVVDTFGCILLGVNEEVSQLSRETVDQYTDYGSEVYGTNLKCTAETAAFLNATSGHALDMDDWEIPGNSHASIVMLTAIFASATHLSGKDLTEAYVMGFEVIARLGEAINFDHYAAGWHSTGTIASIGAAAAVSRLWKLNAEQTANAMSLAISKAAGLTVQFGSHAKPLQAGFAAENGIRSARLARGGLTGHHHVLEGHQGYFELTGHRDKRRYTEPFTRIGQPLGLETYGQVLKPYPSCGYTHRMIDCAAKLKEMQIPPQEIRSITLFLPDFHFAILPFTQPQNRREALFSLPFCAAMGLLHGDLTLADLDNEMWRHQDVKSLISMTDIHAFKPSRPALNYDENDPDRMEICLHNGEVKKSEVPFPTGAPQNPMTSEALTAKFINNASRVRQPQADEVEQLLAWTESDDILPLLSSMARKK